MKQLQYIFSLLFSLSMAFINPFQAQIANDAELFKTLKSQDSLLFEVGFNTCDLSQLDNLTTDDLEFYHDKAGILNSKQAFLDVMVNGICKKDNPFKTRRELVESSLQIFPLYHDGTLYGAIQNGEHKFYEGYEGREKVGSVAKFSHLWILENNQWKIKRIYSFDHHL